jgi:hypothetical protein
LIGSRNEESADDLIIVLDLNAVNILTKRRSRGVVRHTTTKNDSIDDDDEEMREFRYQQRNQRIEILEIVSLLLLLLNFKLSVD